MLKFGTIVHWMNIWRYFLKIFLFGPLGPGFFHTFVYFLKLWGILAKSKVA